MIKLSASLIKDILTCSMRGYFRVESPEQAIETPEMKLGTVIHTAIERHWDDRDAATEYIYNNALNFDLDPTYALSLFERFHYNFRELCSSADEVEKFFELPLSKNVVLVGKLDRINPELGFVLDWKTTKNPPKSIDNDIQFILYHYAYTRLFDKLPELVAYASLTKGKLIKYNKVDRYYDTLFGEVIPRIVKTIQTSNYARDGYYGYSSKEDLSIACTYCSFKQPCFQSEEVID